MVARSPCHSVPHDLARPGASRVCVAFSYWHLSDDSVVRCSDVPRHLARRVHDLYFNPQIEEFAPRTTWSLSNAFTSAFKELDPIPQFRATAKLAPFIESAAAVAN